MVTAGMSDTPDDQPDLVDKYFQPFVRAPGNLVITFALAEAKLLDIVSEMLRGDEVKAVALLKSQDGKDQVLSLAQAQGLSGFDFKELLSGIDSFWSDKAARNRLVHDEWYPSLLEFPRVGIRGLTRSKTPQEVFDMVDVTGVWQLAARFRDDEELFSHRAYVIRRQRDAKNGTA
jgi:hypothetical protein